MWRFPVGRSGRQDLLGFRLEGMIGQGSTSTVYRARRPSSAEEQTVALKLFRRSAPDVIGRLRQEAEALAGVDHPNVVRLLGVVDERGSAGLAMEHAGGGSLATLLARRGALRPEEVVAVAVPLADALAAVHARGLVHGDVKPANILFDSKGQPVLADFGLASPAGHARPAHEPMGTPGYTDPAVLAGAGADHSSDVYALGAVCHEMLTGAPPGPDGLRASGVHVPPALAEVLDRSLAPRPSDRFPDMARMARAIRVAASRLPAPAKFPVIEGLAPGNRAGGFVDEAGPPTRPVRPRVPPQEDAPAPARRRVWFRRAAVIAGGLVAPVAIVGAVVLPLVGGPGDGSSRPRPSSCPPVTADMTADHDGDGCPSAVTWSNNVVQIEGRRYQLGRPGDSLLLGDWDCDGRDTPALYRPGGTVFFFDAWPDEGGAVPAASQGAEVADGNPEVTRGNDGCDRLVVR
jgi:serine/threonine protein kinase